MTTIQCPTSLPLHRSEQRAFDTLHSFAASLADDTKQIDGIGGTDTPSPEMLARLLRDTQVIADLAAQTQRIIVETARENGMSWDQIGAAFGVTKQTVQRKFAKREDA